MTETNRMTAKNNSPPERNSRQSQSEFQGNGEHMHANRSGLTIHRFAERWTEGDLTAEDLFAIWARLGAEGLIDVFFHDGAVRCYYDFLRYVRLSGCWFYAARRGADWLGLGVVNEFSSSGNTAYAHFVTFKAGRNGSFTEAAQLWLPALAKDGGLDTLVAVLPQPYRAARAWAQSLGFVEAMRLPGALRLMRGTKARTADAHVLIKDLRALKSQNQA